jgi:hypothetical protein
MTVRRVGRGTIEVWGHIAKFGGPDTRLNTGGPMTADQASRFAEKMRLLGYVVERRKAARSG